MRDSEFDAEPISKPIEARRRFSRRSIVLAGMALLFACWLGLSSHSSRRYTCAVCREGKVESRLLGLGWASQDETDCSLWYRENVEPSHDHAWAAHGYCRRFGIPGLYGGFACSMGSPITMIPKGEQIKIYEHFQDRLEAKRLFLRLARWGDDLQWTDLSSWAHEGYPGTWHDWWEKHRGAGEG